MLTGLYSAASGMLVQEKVQDVIAQNLAGSQMPGFQREELVIRSFPDVLLSETYRGIGAANNKARYNNAIGRVGTGAGVDWVFVNHTPGHMQFTDDPNAIAIFGDGYFTVNTPEGLRYTRGGNFHVDNEGFLVTPEGYQLMGHGINNGRTLSPIKVNSQSFQVNHFGEIYVNQPDQNQVMRPVLIDQLKVVDFENKDKLFREPGNIFRVEEDDLYQSNFKVPENYRVGQGYVERANTEPTTEMVKLIDSYRIHEASSRVIRALDQTLQKAVNDVGRLG